MRPPRAAPPRGAHAAATRAVRGRPRPRERCLHTAPIGPRTCTEGKRNAVSVDTFRGVRRVLVTGGAGFIGANLLRQMDGSDAIVVLDNLLRGQRALLPEDREVELIVGDIRDPGDVAKAVKGADVVIH